MHISLPAVLRRVAVTQPLVYLLLIGSVFGCAGTADFRPEEPAARMTSEEFANGVALPLVQLMSLVSAFHAERGSIPTEQEPLAAFAVKKGEPIEWRRFGGFEISKARPASLLRLHITSPSSLSKSGEVVTAWRLSVAESDDNADQLRFVIAPTSSLCIVPSPGAPPPRDRTRLEVFLDLMVGHRPASLITASTVCFRGTEGEADAAQEWVTEKLRDRIRRR